MCIRDSLGVEQIDDDVAAVGVQCCRAHACPLFMGQRQPYRELGWAQGSKGLEVHPMPGTVGDVSCSGDVSDIGRTMMFRKQTLREAAAETTHTAAERGAADLDACLFYTSDAADD